MLMPFGSVDHLGATADPDFADPALAWRGRVGHGRLQPDPFGDAA